jgi:uncharacterized protein (TIGR00369 family)
MRLGDTAMTYRTFALPALETGFRTDLARGIEAMPASRLIGLRVSGFARQGISVIELPTRHELTFEGQTVQAGVLGMLADYAGVSAAGCTLPEGWMAATTGYEVHNLAPARGERLVAIGHAAMVGKSHAVSSVEVWAKMDDTHTLVAMAMTTCRPFEFKKF